MGSSVALGAKAPAVARVRELVGSVASRYRQRAFVLEGVRSVVDAVRHLDSVEAVFVDEQLLVRDQRAQAVVDSVEAARQQGLEVDLHVVRAGVLSRMLDSRTPQGLAAVMRIPDLSLQALATSVVDGTSLGLLMIDGVQDPQNLGALIRVAAASGYGGVVCDGRSADPFGPKAARSAVGLLLEVAILRVDQISEAIGELNAFGLAGWPVRIADTHGVAYRSADLASPHYLIMGSEGSGVSPAVRELADEAVTIPLRNGVESLNVGVAAGIIAFEARHQRDRG